MGRHVAHEQSGDTARVLPTIKDRDLVSAPGQAFTYTNTGYELLGCILEQVSGQPYPTFMRDHVFAPLQMTGTGVEAPAPIAHPLYIGPTPVRHLASGYNGQPKQPEVACSQMYKLMASGGIFATVWGLFPFEQACYKSEERP